MTEQTRGTSRPRSFADRIVGVVLAGGGSRRLGHDKTRLMIDGETLVERAARILAAVCREVVVADAGRGGASFASVADGPGAGPAAGILGAAQAFPDASLLVLACDLPLVPESLLAELAERLRCGADLVIPRSERGLEPLCAAYGPRALRRLGERVAGGALALHPLAAGAELDVSQVSGEELARHGSPTLFLLNVNRPEDLEALDRALAGESPGAGQRATGCNTAMPEAQSGHGQSRRRKSNE